MTNGGARRTSVEWRTVDFRPAPPGWRVLAIFDQGKRSVVPMAGWLIQDAVEYDEATDTAVRPYAELGPAGGTDRRVMPAVMVEGNGWKVWPVDWEPGDNTWRILGPGEPEPSEAEWATAVERHMEKFRAHDSGTTSEAAPAEPSAQPCTHPSRGGQEHILGSGTGDYHCNSCGEAMAVFTQQTCGKCRTAMVPDPQHGRSWHCPTCNTNWGWVRSSR